MNIAAIGDQNHREDNIAQVVNGAFGLRLD